MGKIKKTYKQSLIENKKIVKQYKVFNAERIMELFRIEEEIVNKIFIEYDINMTFETFKNIGKEIKIHQKTFYKYGQITNILAKEIGYKNYHTFIATIREK